MAAVSFKPPSQQQSPLPHLRVCTLNILAPCYNYLESGFAPESRDKNRYLQRNTSIIDMLEEQKADVLCLQEVGTASVTVFYIFSSGQAQVCGIYTRKHSQRISSVLRLLLMLL